MSNPKTYVVPAHSSVYTVEQIGEKHRVTLYSVYNDFYTNFKTLEAVDAWLAVRPGYWL